MQKQIAWLLRKGDAHRHLSQSSGNRQVSADYDCEHDVESLTQTSGMLDSESTT